MKTLLAAFLLLFQLQPVLAASVCLGLIQQPPQAECEMPEHGSAPAQHHPGSLPTPAQNCAIASICAPAPLSVPEFPDLLETTQVITALLPISGTAQPLDFYSAPPFHPPKA